MQNRETERKKQFPFKGKQQGLERVTICSHNLKVVHSLFVPRKEKKIFFLHLYIISDQSFFCASDSSFFKQGTLRSGSMASLPTESGREKEFSGLHEYPYISITCRSWEAGKQQQ